MKPVTNLRTYREAEGLSREALAAASGVSRGTIYKLEHADSAEVVGTVKLVNLTRLAKALDRRLQRVFPSIGD